MRSASGARALGRRVSAFRGVFYVLSSQVKSSQVKSSLGFAGQWQRELHKLWDILCVLVDILSGYLDPYFDMAFRSARDSVCAMYVP